MSVPVLICAPIVFVGVIVVAVREPFAVIAGLIPLAIVLPTLQWLDRVEPEPLASRVHAVLWGASVAVLVSLAVNTGVFAAAGEVASMVVSAPLVEEAMKGLGVLWAVRQREVDGVTDGIVYAGWVAIGFAVVEDMSYFATASISGALLPVIVIRAVLTPFAHPLFTFWTGLAIGLAVRDGRRVVPAAMWGYFLAVFSHAMWNGSLSLGSITSEIDESVAVTVVAGVALLFVVLFLAVVATLVRFRREEQRQFVAMIPFLAQQHGLSAAELGAFADWASIRPRRRTLTRSARRPFDDVHAALARLALLHRRLGDSDVDRMRQAGEALATARRDLDRVGGFS